MTELVRKRPYAGLQFTELTPIEVTANASFAWSPTEKAYLTGQLSYDLHQGSVKYPDEVVTTVWSYDPPRVHVPRAYNDGYYRIEIPVEAADWLYAIVDAAKSLSRIKGWKQVISWI